MTHRHNISSPSWCSSKITSEPYFAGPNLALRKFAMQDEGAYLGFTADKAVDGNTSDAATSGACAHTNHSPYSWWKVDLGRTYLLTGIKIYNRERGGE